MILTVVEHCGPKPVVAGRIFHLSKFQTSSSSFLFFFRLLRYFRNFLCQSEHNCGEMTKCVLCLTGQTRPSCVWDTHTRSQPFKTDEPVRAVTSRAAAAASEWKQSHVDEMGEGSRAPAVRKSRHSSRKWDQVSVQELYHWTDPLLLELYWDCIQKLSKHLTIIYTSTSHTILECSYFLEGYVLFIL